MGREMTPGNEATFRGLARMLEAQAASVKTIASYHQGCLSLQRYLQLQEQDTDLLNVGRDQVTGWLIALQQAGGYSLDGGGRVVQSGRPLAKDSVLSYFSSVRRFYSWALAEELTEKHPMAGMDAPPSAGKPIPIPSDEVIRAVLATCRPPRGRKRSFYDLRDELIIRLMAETGGPRCSEVALLPLEHLDMITDTVTIDGKGGKWRRIPMSAATAQAAQRYLNARKKHKHADRYPNVFLGLKGILTPDGVYKAAIRRSRLAGAGKIHPHQYRHAAAHAAKAAGISDGDNMKLFGWTTSKMLERYGAALAEERAIDTSRRLALGNRL